MPYEIVNHNSVNILILTFKGAKGNSFNESMLDEIYSVLRENQKDDDIAGVILTGEGKAFSVGGDVFAMYDALEKNDVGLYIKPIVERIEKVIKLLVSYPKPVIAAVNGPAAGAGMSLALACDFVIAVENAKFGMGFGGVGLTGDSGSTVIFTRHFGAHETAKGIATAQLYSSQELDQRGIIKSVSPESLMDKAKDYIKTIAEGSLYSYGYTKLMANQPIIAQLEHNLPLELKYITTAAHRDEFKEKVTAIVEKLKNKS